MDVLTVFSGVEKSQENVAVVKAWDLLLFTKRRNGLLCGQADLFWEVWGKMKIFEQAREASRLSDHAQHRVGAAVFYKGQFLASGFNSLKTHPSTAWYPKAFTRHAEIHALAKAKAKKFDLTNSTIVVYRETLNGDLGLARPCEMCLDMAIELGIREIFYTTYDNGWERLRL